MSSHTDSSQKTPGEMVRQARKSLGLSLADVAAMTRIPKTMLKHLESDRYDEYSAEVFARGHLRAYAREVQLEPEIVLQAFDRHTGRLSPEPESRESSRESISSADSDEENFWDRFDLDQIRQTVQPAHIAAALLVIVGLFVVFGVLTGKRATAQKSNEFPESSGAATKDWEMEEDSEKSRWLLEQRSSEENTGAKSEE